VVTDVFAAQLSAQCSIYFQQQQLLEQPAWSNCMLVAGSMLGKSGTAKTLRHVATAR